MGRNNGNLEINLSKLIVLVKFCSSCVTPFALSTSYIHRHEHFFPVQFWFWHMLLRTGKQYKTRRWYVKPDGAHATVFGFSSVEFWHCLKGGTVHVHCASSQIPSFLSPFFPFSLHNPKERRVAKQHTRQMLWIWSPWDPLLYVKYISNS